MPQVSQWRRPSLWTWGGTWTLCGPKEWAEALGGESTVELTRTEECCAVVWCGEEHSPHGKRKSSKVKLEI